MDDPVVRREPYRGGGQPVFIDTTLAPNEGYALKVDVPATARVADEASGRKVLARVHDAACVVLAADSLGGAQRALEMSVEYAKVRTQFGRVIGSFQAIKHIAAEMVSEIDRRVLWCGTRRMRTTRSRVLRRRPRRSPRRG